ncbi:MAG: hypothetical protein ACQEVA_16385 [Myxococcota bacterium]
MLDEVIQTFQTGLSSTRAHQQDVPAEFVQCAAEGDDVTELSHTVWVGDKVAYGRATSMTTAGSGEMLDIFVAPRLATASPILSVQIASARGQLELAVLDLFQVATSDVSMRLRDELLAIRRSLSEGFELKEPPESGESMFSDAAIVMQSGRRGGGPISEVIAPFKEMVEHYTTVLERFEPSVLRGLEHRRRRRAEYLDQQAEGVPIGEILKRACDDEWVERTTREFLYPQWLKPGDNVPPWLDEVSVSG